MIFSVLLIVGLVVAQLDRPVPVLQTYDNYNFTIPNPMGMGGAGLFFVFFFFCEFFLFLSHFVFFSDSLSKTKIGLADGDQIVYFCGGRNVDSLADGSLFFFSCFCLFQFCESRFLFSLIYLIEKRNLFLKIVCVFRM